MIRLTAFIGDSNVKVRPLVLIVTEIPFKIHSVDGWEGGGGGGGGAGGEADIKTDNLLKCVLCQILSGRWYQPSLVRRPHNF